MKKFMDRIVTQRIKAFAIDYLIIIIYIGFLLGTTLLTSEVFDIGFNNITTTTAQLLGFFTLTLPVILYFTFTEAGKYSGSIGKKKLGLKVVSSKLKRVSTSRLLLRNFIKFLPWEIAHFFVFQLFYFLQRDMQTPGWVLAGLLASQAIALLYLLLIIFNKNNRSFYELVSQTRVVSTIIS